MARTAAIGKQDFEKVITENCFYVDKTRFIKEWWERKDDVTLITRPRRFGKTLNMSMLEKFFSLEYEGRGDLFKNLFIWKEEKYRILQGTYPVISLTFANVKETDFAKTKRRINQIISELYNKNSFLLKSDFLTEEEESYFRSVSADMDEVSATMAIHRMTGFLARYYGKKVILLLDEYDTPMQEAYINGYWEELTSFTRSLFHAAFKTNPYLERAVMTGITRVSRESVFSDLNNLKVVTTTSDEYSDCFGLTEQEVFDALDEYGLSDRKQEVKRWYDGFTFGGVRDIYNPWSIVNYLDTGKVSAYWANSSSNGLISRLVREGRPEIKKDFEELMNGKILEKVIDEQIVYQQLSEDEDAVWSLLLAGGYLRLEGCISDPWSLETVYRLSLTNLEVRFTFARMIRGWFAGSRTEYHGFVKALLQDDLQAMNVYMNRVALETFSYFDTGNRYSKHAEPERFYHGFVLGLLVDLAGRYAVVSNRESGLGRYDVMLEPVSSEDPAVIMEFKVRDPRSEETLQETVKKALKQIDDKKYETNLIQKGIPSDRIRKYGFAFEGKKVLIGKSETK